MKALGPQVRPTPPLPFLNQLDDRLTDSPSAHAHVLGNRCDARAWNRAQLAELARLLTLTECRDAPVSLRGARERICKRIQTLSRCLTATSSPRLYDAVATEIEKILTSIDKSASPGFDPRLARIRFQRLAGESAATPGRAIGKRPHVGGWGLDRPLPGMV
jgi:hypothetical protein